MRWVCWHNWFLWRCFWITILCSYVAYRANVGTVPYWRVVSHGPAFGILQSSVAGLFYNRDHRGFQHRVVISKRDCLPIRTPTCRAWPLGVAVATLIMHYSMVSLSAASHSQLRNRPRVSFVPGGDCSEKTLDSLLMFGCTAEIMIVIIFMHVAVSAEDT